MPTTIPQVITVQLAPRPTPPAAQAMTVHLKPRTHQAETPMITNKHRSPPHKPMSYTVNGAPTVTPAAPPSMPEPSVAPTVATSTPPTVPEPTKLDLEKLRAQARARVRDERKSTPPGALSYSLQDELKRSLHERKTEMHLAIGMLKIITENGTAICFQPPPIYARDTPGLFGIPMTCP